MTYKIRGEAEIGVGFGLPRHTTASRTSYTPPQKGYKVYDTDMNQEFTWNGTTWATVLDIPDNTDFVDLTTPQQIAGIKTFNDQLVINSGTGGTSSLLFDNDSNDYSVGINNSGNFHITRLTGFYSDLSIGDAISQLTCGTATNRVGLYLQNTGVRRWSLNDQDGSGGLNPILEWQVGAGISGEEDVIMARKKIKSLATVGGDASTTLVTKGYMESVIPDNTDFVDLTTAQSIAGAKTFTDDVFTVQRGALKVIETDNNDVFLRGYNSSSDRDTEVEIDGDQFQVTSTDNDDTKLAKILVSGGGLIQLQTQQAGALVQENRLNLTASGMDLTFYNTGFADRTSLSIAAGEVIMSDVGSDSDFRFEPNSNNFSMSMNNVNVFSYEESTPRFQFNVPVRAAATVDGDAATTLTTKQWVLDKITAGGAVQPDYELVTGTGSASYTLSFTPATATVGKATLQVFVNGLKQIEGATKAYTVSGSVVTFTTGSIPDSGDDVEFYGFG